MTIAGLHITCSQVCYLFQSLWYYDATGKGDPNSKWTSPYSLCGCSKSICTGTDLTLSWHFVSTALIQKFPVHVTIFVFCRNFYWRNKWRILLPIFMRHSASQKMELLDQVLTHAHNLYSTNTLYIVVSVITGIQVKTYYCR